MSRRDGHFERGNRASIGKGRPKRDALIDLFFEQVVHGTTKEGQPFEVERRRALLERLYSSAMDTRRKDHTRLMEIVMAYCFGKPRERVEMSGPDGKPIESADVTPVRRRTTGESRKRLAELLAKHQAWETAKAAREVAVNGRGSDDPELPS
jgi:hypothetical protein